jgi:hypothetical protein
VRAGFRAGLNCGLRIVKSGPSVCWADYVLGSEESGPDRAKYGMEYLRAGLNGGCVKWGLN